VLYQAEPLPDREKGRGIYPDKALASILTCRPEEPEASCRAVTLLALSRYVSFHARGDAAFAWHGLTGDVAEMSRDVLALLLCFDPSADDEQVANKPPEGLTKDQVGEFTSILRARRFLVLGATQNRKVDEISPLLAGIPRVPRATVFEQSPDGVILYTRAGEAVKLDATTSMLFARCDGEHTLGQILGDAGPQALPGLLRLAKANTAALKILAKPASQGGVQLNPAAESTMPYPELPDARAYAAGGPAPQQRAEPEPSLAQLFAEPHKALNGKTYAQALAAELTRRGAFSNTKRLLEVVLGPGLPLAEALPEVKTVKVNLLDGGQPGALPVADEAFDAIVANEITTYLGFADGKNTGALLLVKEAARALAPGGVLFIADFGDPKADATPGSIRFADLQAAATEAGLQARVVPLTEALDMDANHQSLSTTKASFPAMEALFAAHGLKLEKRAWLRTEIEQLAEGKLDLKSVHGLQWAPLSERALGLSPKQFWAMIAQKPERVLH
jgi:SAM-dependent methyltransferase